MKKTLSLLLAFALLAVMLTACATTGPASVQSETPAQASTASPSAEATPEAPESGTVEFTDSAGRTVEIPSAITKISPSGSLAQMFLLAIAPDLLCTIASEYPESSAEYISAEVMSLPVVGQFYGSADLNLEEIAAIGPEIVIDIGEPKETIVEDMDGITEAIAVPSIHITATLDSTPEAFRTLGKILGREEKGEELAAFCEKALASADTVMSAVGGDKVSTLYCMGDAGLKVIAATSFHAEVLDKLTENAAKVDAPSSKGSGNEVDLEQISLWDPDVILFGPGSVYGTVADDDTWSQLSAIQNGDYYEVPFGPYNWMGMPPSINRYLGMLWLLAILYPENADFDLYTEVAEYYDLFYGYDLTVEKYSELTDNSLPAE